MAKNIVNYDSMLVLTHFKGHAMGGSMKNIVIGYADGKIGKQQVHGVSGVNLPWDQWSGKEELMENMADSAKAVIDHFGEKSPSSTLCAACRSTATARGAPPPSRRSPTSGCSPRPACLPAIDQTCVDLVSALGADKSRDLVERIESHHDLRQLSYMRELGMGQASMNGSTSIRSDVAA